MKVSQVSSISLNHSSVLLQAKSSFNHMRGGQTHRRLIRNILSSSTLARHYHHLPTMAEATLATDVPWYAGYPEARSSPATITRSDLLNMIEAGKKPGVDYILIDLRRTDHEVSNACKKARQYADKCTSDREERYRVRSIFLLRACTLPYQHCMPRSELPGFPRSSGTAVSTLTKVSKEGSMLIGYFQALLEVEGHVLQHGSQTIWTTVMRIKC